MLTPKVHSKHKSSEELESFYRLLKLKAHFKDNKNNKLKAEEKIFKPQKKQKWTPNKKHHTVLTYIKVTQRELGKELTKITIQKSNKKRKGKHERAK